MRTVLVGAVLGIAVVSVELAEGALHIQDRPRAAASVADRLARETGSKWAPARIPAEDGVALSAWLLTPSRSNGAVAILLHGVGDSRVEMAGRAGLLLRAGYAALLPDSRGHGVSGGTTVGYGFREASDLRGWSDWLAQWHPEWRQYGLGLSMGGAVLLESLAGPTRLRSAVAEGSFATFEEIAYDRMHQRFSLPGPAFWPVVQLAFLYTRGRYGIDLGRISPEDSLRATRVPVLLIHGARDNNVPPRHSMELEAANPRAAELWLVPGAGHIDCPDVGGSEYQRRVLAWFEK